MSRTVCMQILLNYRYSARHSPNDLVEYSSISLYPFLALSLFVSVPIARCALISLHTRIIFLIRFGFLQLLYCASAWQKFMKKSFSSPMLMLVIRRSIDRFMRYSWSFCHSHIYSSGSCRFSISFRRSDTNASTHTHTQLFIQTIIINNYMITWIAIFAMQWMTIKIRIKLKKVHYSLLANAIGRGISALLLLILNIKQRECHSFHFRDYQVIYGYRFRNWHTEKWNGKCNDLRKWVSFYSFRKTVNNWHLICISLAN